MKTLLTPIHTMRARGKVISIDCRPPVGSCLRTCTLSVSYRVSEAFTETFVNTIFLISPALFNFISLMYYFVSLPIKLHRIKYGVCQGCTIKV